MLPVNNYVLDFRTSCTREEAAAKMLGWLRGPIRWDPEALNQAEIRVEQLTYLPSLIFSLKDHLEMIREAAIEKVILVFDNPNPSEDEQKLATDELLACDELIAKAARFMICIDDELAKGAQSALRIDQLESDRAGELHITLKSLDDWATENYKISILNDKQPRVIDKNSVTQRLPSDATGIPSRGLSKTVSENLYTTFAFLMEAFAKAGPKFQGNDNASLNVQAIANRLEQVAREANQNERLPGQSAESIKGHIERAMRIKKSRLPQS